MQTTGTLRGTRAISLLALLVPLIGYAHSSPLQYLPSIPGYVPVYIRYGDEPLEEINPDLAEAFGETSNSIKNLQKLDTLVRESGSFKDDDIDAFLEESKKHTYPLHVRQTESRSFASVNDESGSGNPNKPKLLTIYELPDDNEGRRRRNRERARMRNHHQPSKPPAFKVSPLSEPEKEELRKLAIEVEKEETKPNELYVPSSKYTEPLGSIHNRHNVRNFGVPIKVQNPFDESSMNIPEIPQADFSRPSDEHDIAIPEADKKGPSIVKEQRPATILSNIDKLSPIDLPDENKTSGDITSEAATPKRTSVAETNSSETPQVIDLLEASRNHDVASDAEKKKPPTKVQRPATILSNVDKLSPIDLPDESDISEDNKRKDSAEPNDEITMD
ncbi:hypothetical protein DMN91_012924 [Ooceraea biroi]|uniref:Uncharacterized protein n=1 Tax=Ooceraea biroi TaxID=2015173 RepID=A0A026WZW2_OOCBI|nr:uncharacterized protein LOC105286412 [Ooceraea biroi]XP_011349665.1 uncharacterized protein LOC105286412 [Ooceraea biroi]EZA61286.1 hypothetical protein X777_11993 [Ooceraea biroi]RLU15037.1 hypothetical protein DMN91_012924 [Ooceraea biroi]